MWPFEDSHITATNADFKQKPKENLTFLATVAHRRSPIPKTKMKILVAAVVGIQRMLILEKVSPCGPDGRRTLKWQVVWRGLSPASAWALL